eukprot:scpid111984/ scgid16865/ 
MCMLGFSQLLARSLGVFSHVIASPLCSPPYTPQRIWCPACRTGCAEIWMLVCTGMHAAALQEVFQFVELSLAFRSGSMIEVRAELLAQLFCMSMKCIVCVCVC